MLLEFYKGMVDYQHVVAVHADAARRKKRNWTEMEEPHFGKSFCVPYPAPGIRLKQEKKWLS